MAETILERLLQISEKIDNPERLAAIQQFGDQYYADAAYLNLIREGLIEALQNSGGISQNNKIKFQSYLYFSGTATPLTELQVAQLMNNSGLINFSETDVPFIIVSCLGVSPAVKHIYAFKNGKGSYGGFGSAVTASMLQYISTLNATDSDLQNASNTFTINLGNISENYITVLNSVERDLSDDSLVYLLLFSSLDVSYSKHFAGTTFGKYGVENPLQFSDDMWKDNSTQETPQSTNLQNVLHSGSEAEITTPFRVKTIINGKEVELYLGEGTLDFNVFGNQLHMNNDGTDLEKPLTLLSEPTEPNHAARLQDIEAISGDFIPIRGTGAGSPFSGVLELSDGSSFIIQDGIFNVGGIITGISFSSGGTTVYDSETGLGLAGSRDFSNNILPTNRNIYAQVGWVADYVAGINLQNVLTNGNTSSTDIVFTDTTGPKGINGSTNGYVKFIDGDVLVGSSPLKPTRFKNKGIELDSSLTEGIKGLGDFSASYTDYSFVQKKWVENYVSEFGGSGGISGVTGVENQIVVSYGTTAPIIGISSAYTTARNTYADNAAANAALGKQNTLVSGTNIKTVGGVTLLGSGDISLSGFRKTIKSDSSASSTLTGLTSISILKDNIVLPANSGNGILDFSGIFQATGTNASKQCYIYVNTSNSLTGATLIRNCGIASNQNSTPLNTRFYLNNGVLTYINNGAANDAAATANSAVYSFAPINPLYFFIAGKVDNASDSIKCLGYTLSLTPDI